MDAEFSLTAASPFCFSQEQKAEDKSFEVMYTTQFSFSAKITWNRILKHVCFPNTLFSICLFAHLCGVTHFVVLIY